MNKNLVETVLLLLADGKPHSLPSMSIQQRNTILQQLQIWGLKPQRLENHTYYLEQPLNLLDQDSINRTLQYGQAIVLRSVDSTNEFLLQHKSLPSGTICSAEIQTAGRGRRGRPWHSPFAQNLYFSLLWHFELSATALQPLSLIVGICLADTLCELGAKNISIKWPNDIYLNGRKLGGILIESRQFNTKNQELVIGIGLNLHMQQKAAATIDQPWANLNESTINIERNQLVATLSNNLQRLFLQLPQHGITPYLQRWQQYDHFYQQPISLVFANHSIQGICQGIDQYSGELLVKTHNGLLQRFNIGEISLRSSNK